MDFYLRLPPVQVWIDSVAGVKEACAANPDPSGRFLFLVEPEAITKVRQAGGVLL